MAQQAADQNKLPAFGFGIYPFVVYTGLTYRAAIQTIFFFSGTAHDQTTVTRPVPAPLKNEPVADYARVDTVYIRPDAGYKGYA